MSIRPVSFNISLFEIYSSKGIPVNVSGAFSNLFYYESILDNTVRVTATFADTGNRDNQDGSSALEQDDANLTAGEIAHLIIEDEFGNTLTFKDNTQLRIKEVRNIIEDSIKAIYTIDFYSQESITNEFVKSRVSSSYDGRISDTVYNILVRDCIKTEKNVDIDSCLNDLCVWGNTDKPFYKLAWLAKRAVPDIQNSPGNYAGYFFYETSEGYKFKSIDKLFTQNPKKKLIYNNTTGLPEGYDNKILEYSFDSVVDIHKKLLTGALSKTELRTFESYKNQYDGEGKKEFESSKQFNQDNNGGKTQIEVACDLNVKDEATRTTFKMKDIGIARNLDKKEEVNFDIDNTLRQSSVRYNNLFTIKLSIAIYGDMTLHPGDLLHCDFPEISDKKNQVVSQRKSGIYMIVDLCHMITPTGVTYTRLNLVRDSLGRKPF